MTDPSKIRNEVLQKLKTFSETVTDTMGDISKGKNIFCAAPTTSKRLGICNGCEFFVRQTTQCKKCGCFMSAKTRLKKASCPIGKWTKE